MLQLNAFLAQVYAQLDPEQAPVLFGFAGHLPLAFVQRPPAPSDRPHEFAALQSGVLHWFSPETQTWPVVHCELQTSEFLSEAHAVTEQAPHDAPSVPDMAVQPPHTLAPAPLHDSEFLSALQAHF